jgi:hypothetical protein
MAGMDTALKEVVVLRVDSRDPMYSKETLAALVNVAQLPMPVFDQNDTPIGDIIALRQDAAGNVIAEIRPGAADLPKPLQIWAKCHTFAGPGETALFSDGVRGIAGERLSAGDAVYQRGDGKWYRSQSGFDPLPQPDHVRTPV